METVLSRYDSDAERNTSIFVIFFTPRAHAKSSQSEGGLSTTSLNRAVDRQGLEKMLRRLEKVDLDSLTRVAESKVR